MSTPETTEPDDEYEGPIKLAWDNDAPEGVAEKVLADIRCSLWGLDNPAGLIFHHVQLTDDHEGPMVHVYGVEGSDAFHCLYCEKTELVTADGESVK